MNDPRKPALLLFSVVVLVIVAACAAPPAPEAPPPTLAVTTVPPTLPPTAEAAPPADDTAVPQADEPAPADEPVQEAAPVTLSGLQVTLVPVASGLRQPIGLVSAGDGSGRLFVLEKAGTIRIIRNGTLLPEPFLNITDRVQSSSSEQGLLGLAFHPDYTQNGVFFVNYTARGGDTIVSRFSVTADPDRADPTSEERVLRVGQPAVNHNGGHLAFGPDGYLYIGLGDGGGAGDRFGHGQNGATLLGAMLRLDVSELPYRIPPDNPFVNDPAVLDEIWAIGLRNPWRYSFDRLTGDLVIADVGQNRYEEVSLQPAGSSGGENYGWPIMEGLNCYNAPDCDQAGLVLPILEYDHSQGCSITGGHVYRGEASPALSGVYLFGDYCSGRIWGAAPSAEGGWQMAELLQSNLSIASFGEDDAGEVYVADMRGGGVYRLAAP